MKTNLEHRCKPLGKKSHEIVLTLFQKCAFAPMKQQFEVNVLKLKHADGFRGEAFFRDTQKEMWANANFIGDRYGQMTSNVEESWNAQIHDERLFPIVSLIDGIRSLLMQQMCTLRQQASM